jgi:ribonuclease Z
MNIHIVSRKKMLRHFTRRACIFHNTQQQQQRYNCVVSSIINNTGSFHKRQQRTYQNNGDNLYDEFDPYYDEILNTAVETEESGPPPPYVRFINGTQFSGMRLIFLGTSSMRPTKLRNVTSIALQLDGETWLFDCGEGTQNQIMKSSLISKISNIFITHLHGDHVFGLPGLATQLNTDRRNLPLALNIFGPLGIRQFVTNNLRTTSSQHTKRINITELLPRGGGPNGITPDINNVYHVLQTEKYTVTAKLIQHSVPCFGWVITEKDTFGALNVEKCKSLGLKSGPEYKRLKQGHDIVLPNGRVIYSKDVVGESIPGRKVVILGDTCDASSIADIAENATVLIHETTLPDEHERLAYSRGHATPRVAGKLARQINAKELYITHFGGSCSGSTDFIETVMVPQAQKAFGKPDVIAAEDFMVVNIPPLKNKSD